MLRRGVLNRLAFALFGVGVFLMIDSQDNITGAAIGISNYRHSASILGILFIAASLIILSTKTGEKESEEKKGLEGKLAGGMSYKYPALINDQISNRTKKGLAYYGRKVLHSQGHSRGIDLLYCKHSSKKELVKDYHYELGKIAMILRSWNNLTPDQRRDFTGRYVFHSVEKHGQLGDNAYAIDAPNLNDVAGHRRRGDYRYIFLDHGEPGKIMTKKKGAKPHRYEFAGIAMHAGGRAYRLA